MWKREIFPSLAPYLISETSLTKSETRQFHKTDWSASLWGSPDSASPGLRSQACTVTPSFL